MDEFKQIKIRKSTYDQLVYKRKSGQSFDTYIGIMLNYFRATNIAPESWQSSPGVEIKNAIERIIKIQKAQEKDYFKDIREIKSYISKGKEIYLQEHAEEIIKSNIGDGLTTEQLNEFLGAYEAEKQRANRLNALVEEQEKQIRSLRQNTEPGSVKFKDELIDQLNMLKEETREHDTNNYRINKNVFDNAIEDMKKLLK